MNAAITSGLLKAMAEQQQERGPIDRYAGNEEGM